MSLSITSSALRLACLLAAATLLAAPSNAESSPVEVVSVDGVYLLAKSSGAAPVAPVTPRTDRAPPLR